MFLLNQTLTSGVNAISAQAVLADSARHGEGLAAARKSVSREFNIAPATIQGGRQQCAEPETHLSADPKSLLASYLVVVHDPRRLLLLSRIDGDAPHASKF